MPKAKIITGLDIGTSSIKALTVLKKPESPDLEVLSQVQEPCSGMRRGVVANVEEVSKNIKEVLFKLQNNSQQKIKEVYVNINGHHIFNTPSRGTVIVSRADQKISQEDINRVIQAAQTFSLPYNKEILDVFPQEFIIDGQREIKEPLGMQGLKLEAEILAICVFSPYLKNLTNAVLNAGIQIANVVPSPIVSAKAVLTSQQKELGVALVDIGAATTGLAVYEEGILIHLAVFPVGSTHITNDLAIGLKTDIDIAERIKKEFGSCLRKGGGSRKKIEIPQEENPLIFSQKMLVKIIEARISEIFDLIQEELKTAVPHLLPAGVVITGGGAKLPKIVDLAKKELKLPCRIGIPQIKESNSGPTFIGLEEDPVFSAACGLVLGGLDIEAESWTTGRSWFPSFGKRIGAKIKKIIKSFIP